LAGAEEDCRGSDRGVKRGEDLGRSHSHRGRAGGIVLQSRGVSPGLLPLQPVSAVLHGGGFTEGGQVPQAFRRQAEIFVSCRVGGAWMRNPPVPNGWDAHPCSTHLTNVGAEARNSRTIMPEQIPLTIPVLLAMALAGIIILLVEALI